ncbi:PTS sugar transporter subunit IIB [Metabacillus arenae]|uniref:PTS sugar transporter subunit IIB n=1 Tax=Metabacillus arenae TaxID=2771434 RepID=A0A926RXK5_9BACI|nr:PTS sugar transporter subunit IIB [Metabacillus arenae]MBD1381978.1 PTS sugar transporter subunit IIB [Metabacillus arenae]
MKKTKILMVCGAGLGSSFACEMSVEAVLNDLNVSAELGHCDISSAASEKSDIIITGANFESQFNHYDIKSRMIYLKRMVDKQEIKEKLAPILKEMGVLS